MHIADLVVVGRELEVVYVLGGKDLGRVRVVAVHNSTIQTTSVETGNTLWLPNPLAADVWIQLTQLVDYPKGDTFTTLSIVEQSNLTRNLSKRVVVYAYKFYPLENSNEIFPCAV